MRHAPSAPRGFSARVRRVRGCRMGNPGAGYPPAPGGLRRPPREPSSGSPGPCGSPGPPCGARVAAISVPGPSSASRSARWSTKRSRLQSFDGQRLRNHRWRLAVTGWPGPPGSRPSNTRAYLPGAGPCHVGCWYRTPRRKQGRGSLGIGQRRGDNTGNGFFHRSIVNLNFAVREFFGVNPCGLRDSHIVLVSRKGRRCDDIA